MSNVTNGSNEPIKKAVMSNLKLGRLQVLTAYYKEGASNLLDLIQARGRNDYNSIMSRLDNLLAADSTAKAYYTALSVAFKGKEFMDASTVASSVCAIRQKSGLPRFTGKDVLKQSVNELHKLFLVHEKMETSSLGRRERKYKPMFSLLVL